MSIDVWAKVAVFTHVHVSSYETQIFRRLTGCQRDTSGFWASQNCQIRYPSGSEYLRAAIQNVEAVSPGQVEPLYGEIFAAQFGLPFRVQVWCPDVLTSYVVHVLKMVCFFEVAFENDLCFPLHPFIKRVL